MRMPQHAAGPVGASYPARALGACFNSTLLSANMQPCRATCWKLPRASDWRIGTAWLQWGPYLAERQWGTVREDYSADGDAWTYFPYEHARSRAYRWGEDGIAGFTDDRLRWCLSLALWNGHDPILKERMFGLTNAQGNHGEDVKELYYFLDGTPTHSYMRMLYKYPQAAFPYAALIAENASRGLDLAGIRAARYRAYSTRAAISM